MTSRRLRLFMRSIVSHASKRPGARRHLRFAIARMTFGVDQTASRGLQPTLFERQVLAPHPTGASQNPGGRSSTTPKARSNAKPTLPKVPSSNKRPIRVTPCGTRRGVVNVGRGLFGSGAQSLRAFDTSTKPARNVSEGCPVKLVMVKISSRKEGTSRRSTSEKTRSISLATWRRRRSACTKSTAERNRAWRNRFGHASGTWAFSWFSPPLSVILKGRGAFREQNQIERVVWPVGNRDFNRNHSQLLHAFHGGAINGSGGIFVHPLGKVTNAQTLDWRG